MSSPPRGRRGTLGVDAAGRSGVSRGIDRPWRNQTGSRSPRRLIISMGRHRGERHCLGDALAHGLQASVRRSPPGERARTRRRARRPPRASWLSCSGSSPASLPGSQPGRRSRGHPAAASPPPRPVRRPRRVLPRGNAFLDGSGCHFAWGCSATIALPQIVEDMAVGYGHSIRAHVVLRSNMSSRSLGMRAGRITRSTTAPRAAGHVRDTENDAPGKFSAEVGLARQSTP